MRNDETPWEVTRWRIDNRLDNALFLPVLLFVVGAVGGDVENLQLGVWSWFAVLLLWTPWLVLRTAMNGGDTARAAAVLGIGVSPWGAILPLFPALDGRTPLLAYGSVVILTASAAIILVLRDRPRLGATARKALLAAGALGFAAVGAGPLLVLAVTGASGFDVIVSSLCLLVGGACVIAAVAVFAAIFRPPPRVWARTSDPIL